MKKNNFLNKFLLILTIPVIMLGCSDDGGVPSATADFSSIASSYFEDDGTATITIPVRNGSFDESDVTFGGTAIEGEDFNFVGVTDEGVQVEVIDDANLEANETIAVRVLSSNGNNTHTVTIVSNCEDTGGLLASSFAGSWAALEDYGAGGTFGPYNVTLTQDATNLNRFTFPNFYGSGATYTAYMIFDIPNGTVSFPDQIVGAPANNRGPITLSSGTFDLCTAKRTLDITLFYDGLQWDYHFTKN